MPWTAGTRGAAGRSAHMESPRPFTDPLTVGLAGVTLLAFAAGSFANALAHKLSLPSAVEGAEVVVLPPSDAPPPLAVPALANLETAPKSKAAPQPAPAAEPAPAAAPQIVQLVPPPAADAHEIAEDAAATGATHSEQPEPPAPPPEEAPAY